MTLQFLRNNVTHIFIFKKTKFYKNLDVRIRSFGQQIKNAEEVSTPVVNSEYYQIKQKREQKQLNLRNANKAGSEKSCSLSRENKAKQDDEDEILTEAQIDRDQENSLNNSVRGLI